jgi:dTDP-4-dehydrorhamnose 3,5-epimerase-like enzyme
MRAAFPCAFRNNLSNVARHSDTRVVSPHSQPGANMEIERIPLQQHGDHRGMLIALEENRNVPFDIRRVYYLFATKNDVHRGQHAHRHLKQMAVTLRGSVTILLDDGNGPIEVVLNDPTQGLLIGNMVWRDLYNFSDDCVLMVIADQLYDPTDYITDYAVFLREAKGLLYLEDRAACAGG